MAGRRVVAHNRVNLPPRAVDGFNPMRPTLNARFCGHVAPIVARDVREVLMRGAWVWLRVSGF